MAQPHPAVAATRSAVAAAVADLPMGSLVLVACSGGPDSLALAAATAFVAERGGRTSRVGSADGARALRAGAVVVDHGLQDGSDEVAARAAAACRALGLDPVLVERAQVGRAGGPEAAARDARYDSLAAAASRLGAAAVLLGHTLDDQAETVLLGLARGSGGRSLAGMPPVRGVLRRPLLGLRRDQTLAACEAQGLEPWHDPSNAPDAEPLRSRVRGEVLPLLERVLGPGVAESLARTAEQLRADTDALDEEGDALLATAGGPAGLDVGILAKAHAAVRARALRRAALEAGVPGGALRAEHVAALDALVVGWRGQGPVHLPGGVVGRRACGTMELVTSTPRTSSDARATQ
jgi:tRNA(Ile)-lysidine synthase